MGYGHRAVRCEMEADPGTGVPRLTLIAEVRGASEIDSFRSAEAPRTGVRTTPADRLESVLTELGHLPGP